jgi:hypothetical protein
MTRKFDTQTFLTLKGHSFHITVPMWIKKAMIWDDTERFNINAHPEDNSITLTSTNPPLKNANYLFNQIVEKYCNKKNPEKNKDLLRINTKKLKRNTSDLPFTAAEHSKQFISPIVRAIKDRTKEQKQIKINISNLQNTQKILGQLPKKYLTKELKSHINYINGQIRTNVAASRRLYRRDYDDTKELEELRTKNKQIKKLEQKKFKKQL